MIAQFPPGLPPLPVGPGLPPGPASTPEPGSVVLVDNFLPSATGSMPHGQITELAARRQGGNAPLQRIQLDPNRPEYQQVQQAQLELSRPGQSPQAVEGALRDYTRATHLGLLRNETDALRQATAAGTHHSALNMSQGESAANVVQTLYGQARSAWDPNAGMFQRMNGLTQVSNYARAFGLNEEHLLSPDPALHGPERQRLQQALVDRVSRTAQGDPQIGQARGQFGQAVRDFEANHNSVVVSAGNAGTLLGDLRADAGGLSVRVPRDFERNVLSTPDTTTVGATRWYSNQGQLRETRANYSSHGPVDVYASGSLGLDPTRPDRMTHPGTSYAAPRVAGAMAELHRRHPDLSSAQVQQRLQQQLTHSRSNADAPVLDDGRTRQFLEERTF